MNNETIYILPDFATERPKQFKTWIDFYDFIKKNWDGQAEIVHFAEYLTPEITDEKPRISKYYMVYIKSKCFEEQENFKAPDFTADELIYLTQAIRMNNSFQNKNDLVYKIYSMIDLKHKEERELKGKVELP